MQITEQNGWVRVSVLCLTLAGCSKSADKELSCDVAPADEMATTMELSGLGAPVAKTTNGVQVCSYAQGANPNAVILRMVNTDTKGFEATRASFDKMGATTQPVQGLGQQAFSVTMTTGSIVSNTVAAFDGTTEVQISSVGPTVEAMKSMVAKVLTRLAAER